MILLRFSLYSYLRNYFILFFGMFILTFSLSALNGGLRYLEISKDSLEDYSSIDNQYFSVSDDNSYNETKEEMERRKYVLREVCRREALGTFASEHVKPKFLYPPAPNYENFYFDRKHSLAWCPIYKSASTSWLYNFCRLGGLSEVDITSSKAHVSTVARGVWPSLDYDDGKLAMDEAKVKFFIVRHPFERLISAYRDKFENIGAGIENGTLYFYKTFGKRIVKKYRRNGNGSKHTHQGNNVRPEPTFQEFVKFLINSNLAYSNEHWRPYYLYCAPCSIEYDVIAKFETLSQDQNFIITQAHLDGKIKPVWKHKTQGRESASLIQKYFSTITKSQGLRLYEKYQLDFEMFEYSLDDYKKHFIDD